MMRLKHSSHRFLRHGRSCFAAVFALLCWNASQPSLSASEHDTEAPLLLPKLSNAPTIDGVIDSEEWSAALRLGTFSRTLKIGAVRSSSEPQLPGAEAWVATDGHFLFIAVRCEEPTPALIKTLTIADEKDGSVASDDHIHIVLDVGNTQRQELYDLLINSEGTLAHSRSFGIHFVPGSWESGATARTHVGKAGWELEVAIPLQSLGHVFQIGEMLGINIGRTRYAGGSQGVVTSLRSPFDHHVKKLIPLLVEGDLQTEELTFRSLHRGPFSSWEAGEWRFEIAPTKVGELVIRWPRSGREERRALSVGAQVISLPFPSEEAPERSEIELAFLDEGGEKTPPFYRSEHAVTESINQLSIPETKEPLFEELITPRPDGLSKDGFIVWRHALQGSTSMTVSDFARKSGMAFTDEEIFREWGKERAIVVTSTPRQLTPELLAQAEEHGVRYIVYPLFRGGAKLGAPLNGAKFPWMLDPRSEQAYLEDVQRIIDLAKQSPSIWGILAGDEAFETARVGFRYALLTRPKELYPEFEAANADAKKRFGFGKYGFPLDLHDTNPFRWIATARWEADRMFAIQAKVKEMISEQCPRLKLVSWDPMTAVHARSYRRWGSLFDIVTGQINSNYGFYTKVTADLTQARELWMCAHVEHYLGNYTPREVEELLSDVFRHGGTGLHLYMLNVIKGRIGAGSPLVDRYGAPERWNAVKNILKRIQETPFRVEQEFPDTGVFVSTLSYLSQGRHPNPKTDDLLSLYNILGPRLKQAFTFIDETACEPQEAASLSRFKTIYVPSAPIVDDDVYDGLERFVEGGGRLVVCDPLAFRWRSDGTQRLSGTLLAPLVDKKPESAYEPARRLRVDNLQLEALGRFQPLSADEATVLAQTEDGRPAILSRAVGEGSIQFWAQNPLGPNVAESKGWVAFLETLQKEVGARESKIWRFRFPEGPGYEEAHPKGLCLTGNGMEWRQSEPRLVHNAIDVHGSYLLSAAPIGNVEPATTEIPLTQGRLHDRHKGALSASNTKSSDYILSWKDAPADFYIRYRFSRSVRPSHLRLYTQGDLPAGIVEVSADEKEWQLAGEWPQKSAMNKGVILTNVTLSPQDCRFVRLRFPQSEGKQFSIAELDIWEAPVPAVDGRSDELSEMR